MAFATPASLPMARFAQLAARCAEALRSLAGRPEPGFAPQPPVEAPWAPATITGRARRFFQAPYAPESQALALAVAHWADCPEGAPAAVSGPLFANALAAIHKHAGPIPDEDGERIVGMAVSFKSAPLAIAAAQQGLYYPWVANRGHFSAIYEELDTASIHADEMADVESIRALIDYAGRPERQAEEDRHQLRAALDSSEASSAGATPAPRAPSRSARRV